MYQQEERDWHKSAIKYYQSYRILQFLGYTKQGLNMLLSSVEKLLKTLIAIRLNLSEKELRERYNHSLKRLLADSNLDEKEFPNIFGISNKFQYNKIRYEFEVIPNIINLNLRELDAEIKKISRLVMMAYNKKHHTCANPEYWPIKNQYLKYKEYFLNRALKGRDDILRIDCT